MDEEDEYECVTVVNSHTQDVKHVVWHPTQEVGPTWICVHLKDLSTTVDHVFNYMCFHSSWLQPATTTTFVFTKKRMMTGSARPPCKDTHPQSGVCLLMGQVRDWPPAAMTAQWRYGRSIQMKLDRVSCCRELHLEIYVWMYLIRFYLNSYSLAPLCFNRSVVMEVCLHSVWVPWTNSVWHRLVRHISLSWTVSPVLSQSGLMRSGGQSVCPGLLLSAV